MATKLMTTMQPFLGLSSDTKPTTGISAGSTYLEYDTGNTFAFTGTVWTLKSPSLLPYAVTTVDLNQAAGDYDLFTAGSVDVRILSLTVVSPADLTDEAALTSISVQSTDTTPVVFISSTEGAVANLTANAHLQYNGNETVAATKKIQLSINGTDGTAAEQICPVFLTYAEIN